MLQEMFAGGAFKRGFLPAEDPMWEFPEDSPYRVLDVEGKNLPQNLLDPDFRKRVRCLELPAPPLETIGKVDVRTLRLLYVRYSFIAKGYVLQIKQPPVYELPRNIAGPLVRICKALGEVPMHKYNAYVLWNWKRIDPNGPIELGNLATIQNFTYLPDAHGVNQESWFQLVHVDIEGKAAPAFPEMERASRGYKDYSMMCGRTRAAVNNMIGVLRRIPEHMDPATYYYTFRPYIDKFAGVKYEGVSHHRRNYRGQTGAQSSILPLLDAFFKVPHKRDNQLAKHVLTMRYYMPPAHRKLIAAVRDELPNFKRQVPKDLWDSTLDAIAEFRSVHYGWAKLYVGDHGIERGTGDTDFRQFLPQLRQETLDTRNKK